MRITTLFSLAQFTPLAFTPTVSADNSCSDAQVVADYVYCQPVDRAVIQNVGHSGTYQKVTGMDSTTGQIESAPFPFSGPLAPFDEDLSLHLRGPLNLKQFAAYIPVAAKKKRSTTKHHHMANHAHIPARRDVHHTTVVEIEEIEENVVVQTTLHGNATTFTSLFATSKFLSVSLQAQSSNIAQGSKTFSGDSTYGSRPSFQKANAQSFTLVTGASASANETPLSYDSQSNPTQTSTPMQQSQGDWQRTALYDSDSKISQGITFMNNKGGQGSGVFDVKFGLSLSYADGSAETAAQSSTIFDGFLNNTVELAIFSDEPCSEESCGFWRPGAPAYMGFGGASKLFLIEFSMPNTAQPDQPAIWFLNGQIPRVGQYLTGNCWSSGCGEMDIFEVLSNGSNYLIPTVHAQFHGGFNDFFVRPTDISTKAAILMNDNNVIIQILPAQFQISSSISAAQIQQLQLNSDWGSMNMASLKLVS